jgi:hypothetical protein
MTKDNLLCVTNHKKRKVDKKMVQSFFLTFFMGCISFGITEIELFVNEEIIVSS